MNDQNQSGSVSDRERAPAAPEITARELQRDEIRLIWSIDRSEVIDRIYYIRDGKLTLEPEHYDLSGWPPGEDERYTPILEDCFDRGGWFFGYWHGERLCAVVVLENRWIGEPKDMLQLKFLHVDRSERGSGLGRTLFEDARRRALQMGARRLYVSATPSENTVNFYLHRGCRLAARPDAALFALEPEDIHLECQIG